MEYLRQLSYDLNMPMLAGQLPYHLSFEQQNVPVVRANNTGAHKHDGLNKEGYIHYR